MLLAIDIGNTQTVLGLFEGAELRYTWRFASVVKRSSDELSATLSQLYDEIVKSSGVALLVNQVVIASVVPELTQTWVEVSQSVSHHRGANKALIVDAHIANRLSAHIPNPAELGADRIANALAAKMLYGSPAIVLDFGTATNVDVINEEGNYIGGIISPGIQTAATALFESAARLPVTDFVLPDRVLGTTTRAAVQSGLLYGEAAKINYLIAALKKEQPMLGYRGVPVIATGGLAPLVTSLLVALTHYDEHLTLKGLFLIADLVNRERTRTQQHVAAQALRHFSGNQQGHQAAEDNQPINPVSHQVPTQQATVNQAAAGQPAKDSQPMNPVVYQQATIQSAESKEDSQL